MSQKVSKAIPVKFTPAFFITAALIGFLNSYSLVGTIVWIGIILLSVLVHEYGHAITSKLFGQHPKIELVAFGGVTIPEGKKLTPGREFLVVLMGPMFGFFLFLGSLLLYRMQILPPFAQSTVTILAVVNLFWTVINLLPILPLDGGQLVRIVLEKIFGARAFKATLYLSILLGAIFSVGFFIYGFIFIGVIFLLLTFQNIETLRRFHYYSDADGQDENRNELKEIEQLLRHGQVDEASSRLDRLVRITKTGLIHVIAAEYLAKIKYDLRDYKTSYDLLTPIQSRISKEAKCILFLAAFEIKDYDQVIHLSGECFSEKQTADVAIRAAASHAAKKEKKSALEWLKTAKAFGGVDLSKVTKDALFDPIRNDEDFKQFVSEEKK